jgi:hypothetical protein
MGTVFIPKPLFDIVDGEFVQTDDVISMSCGIGVVDSFNSSLKAKFMFEDEDMGIGLENVWISSLWWEIKDWDNFEDLTLCIEFISFLKNPVFELLLLLIKLLFDWDKYESSFDKDLI